MRDDKMGQTWPFPVSVLDLIPEGHICHVVADIVNSMETNELEKGYRGTPCNPAYSRLMLLRLVIMASVDAVWSSREIAKLARENVIYMYLAGNEKPDFRTICNFKKECRELLEAAFKRTLAVAKAAGVVKLGYISMDGRKRSASAANRYTLSKAEQEEIRKILERGLAVDDEEDRLYGDTRGDELPPELDTPEKIRRKIEEFQDAAGMSL
jgi:transposase